MRCRERDAGERNERQRHGNIGSLATGQRMTTNQILSRREGAPLQGWAGGSEVDAGRRRGPRRHPLCSRKIHPFSRSSFPSPLGSSSSPGMLFPLLLLHPSLTFCLLCSTPLSTSRQVFVSFLPSLSFLFFYDCALPSLSLSIFRSEAASRRSFFSCFARRASNMF